MRDEERHLLRQRVALRGRFTHKDRYAGLELRRFDSHGQAPAESRFQPFFEPGDLLWIAVTRQHNLPLTFEQCIERMEEFLLRPVFPREELYVVDQQCIEGPVCAFELSDGVVPQPEHHVADEALRMHIGHLRTPIARLDQVADRVHQVRFAEADTTVDEQRVVGAPGILCDLNRRGPGQLVALALNETVERERRIESAAQCRSWS